MYRLCIALHLQDPRALPGARQGISQTGMTRLDTATQIGDCALVCETSRREHLLHILPPGIVDALPGLGETFALDCANGQRHPLPGHAVPVLCQILRIEHEEHVRAIKLVHHDGCRKWIYCL